MKEITGYMAFDGEIFDTSEKCYSHEKDITEEVLAEVVAQCRVMDDCVGCVLRDFCQRHQSPCHWDW